MIMRGQKTLLRCKWINFNFSFQCTHQTENCTRSLFLSHKHTHRRTHAEIECVHETVYCGQLNMSIAEMVNFPEFIPFELCSSALSLVYFCVLFTFDFRAKEIPFNSLRTKQIRLWTKWISRTHWTKQVDKITKPMNWFVFCVYFSICVQIRTIF